MKLVFSMIKNKNIFQPDFDSLTPDNGTIVFKHKSAPGGIAVIYAPNGAGKTSFANVLGVEVTSEDIAFKARNDANNTILPETKAFHVIPDQINRDIIRGDETDYLIGKQIREEYKLRNKLNQAYKSACDNLSSRYKNEFKISKVNDYLLAQIGARADVPCRSAYEFIRDLVNSKSRGTNINQTKFVEYIRDSNNKPSLQVLDEDKREFIISDMNGKAKIAERIIKLAYQTVIPNVESLKVEQHDDAIGILKKYHSFETCIVCDNENFDGDTLLHKKEVNRQHIYDTLDQKTKDLLDKVVMDSTLAIKDPFEIKRIVSEFIAGGDTNSIITLQNNLKTYVKAIGDEMIEALFHCFDGSSFLQDFDKYNMLVSTQPQFDSEELLFIEEVINENITGKDITIVRDETSKNYKLKLGNKDLIGTNRKVMELSTGEQNFISLAFELLMARHSDKEYVVLDDPISSFDSVYKNKIAFCIIKFLEGKKQIILTHNTELVHLLNVQLNNCFYLYILNNSDDGKNGLIPVNDTERDLLINLHVLVKFFQNKDNCLIQAIKNRRQFLMAMIPFLRGYAHISLDPDDDFGTLSGIMHGYEHGSIDIVPIYKKLFGYDFGSREIVTVADILGLNVDALDILDKTKYPLLADTLEQTLVYYHLRMKVEKVLVDAFHLSVRDNDTLNQIILNAFNCTETDPDFESKRNFKVFFTSRKTLLNEFNHFEGNMNIFQPAIDITNSALQKERVDIEKKLNEVKVFAAGAT